jgi:hypothetical protein
MSLAVHTGLRDISGRQMATLPLAVRQALMQADEVLRLHGLQFEVICEACSQRSNDPNAWTAHAEHGADGSVNALVCRCTRRQFLSAF